MSFSVAPALWQRTKPAASDLWLRLRIENRTALPGAASNLRL
jgi:hypothetical protein